MSERFKPCLEKNCSWCCDPVKVPRFFPDEKIPINENGQKIWKRRDEIFRSAEHESVRLDVYDCINFDPKTGRCTDYAGRPEICRQTSCINSESSESIDEQHRKMTSEKFISVPIKRK
ncbi:MAG: YkgJ family cysteine cluster protein [Patescibacteria group bacterium]